MNKKYFAVTEDDMRSNLVLDETLEDAINRANRRFVENKFYGNIYVFESVKIVKLKDAPTIIEDVIEGEK